MRAGTLALALQVRPASRTLCCVIRNWRQETSWMAAFFLVCTTCGSIDERPRLTVMRRTLYSEEHQFTLDRRLRCCCSDAKLLRHTTTRSRPHLCCYEHWLHVQPLSLVKCVTVDLTIWQRASEYSSSGGVLYASVRNELRQPEHTNVQQNTTCTDIGH